MRESRSREELREIGQRMEEAATDAGLGAYEVAAAMKVTHSSVYNWFNGVQQPRQDKMEQFGQLVGRPVSWIYGAEEAKRDMDQEVMDRLLGILERVRGGADLGEAYEEEMRGTGKLPPAIKRLWSLQSDIVRPRIADADWSRLSEKDRKAAAKLIHNWGRMSREEQERAARQIANWVEGEQRRNGH